MVILTYKKVTKTSMNNMITEISKTTKQKIWAIKGRYPIHSTKKNFYVYDFGVIMIREKNGRIRRYDNRGEDTSIYISYQRIDGRPSMTIKDMFHDETLSEASIDLVLIYLEKSSQSVLALTTAATFADTDFFMNTVTAIELSSLREEALSLAYMADDTRATYDMLNRYFAMEGGSDTDE